MKFTNFLLLAVTLMLSLLTEFQPKSPTEMLNRSPAILGPPTTEPVGDKASLYELINKNQTISMDVKDNASKDQ